MTTAMRPGTRLRSAVCETEVVVVRAPAEPTPVWCGGHPMVAMGEEPRAGTAVDPAHAGGTALGKRYTSDDGSLELLCTKPGRGSLSVAGAPLGTKSAKPLPASD